MPTWSNKLSAKRVLASVGIAILVLCGVIGVRQTYRRAAADYDGPRVHTWTLTGDAWLQGEMINLTVARGALTLVSQANYGVSVSPVVETPYPFTGVAVHLDVVWPPGSNLVVELRLRPIGGEWSPWQALEEFSPEPDGRYYSDDLIFPAAENTRQVQVRLSLLDDLNGVSPQVRDLTLVAIDAHAGPTAAEAQAAARARITATPSPGLPQPTIISRAEWGADESKMTWPPEYAPVEKIILHHTVSGGTGDPATEIRTIYHYHAVTRGWGDIGYNFVVDRAGDIYEGRYGGLDVIGAHAAYWNDASLGVSVLGCYHSSSCSPSMYPTSETLNALTDLFAWQASRRLIDPQGQSWFFSRYLDEYVYNYHLAGHRDYGATACPGNYLYAELPGLRQAAWEQLPDYDVRFDEHDTPEALETDQTVTIHLTLHNAGRLTWRDQDGVRLGYRWLQGDQVVLENVDAAHLSADVVYGDASTLLASMVTPSQVGHYTLRWDLYRPGIGWFSEQPPPSGRSQALDVSVQIDDPMPTPTPTPKPTDVPGALQAQAQVEPPAVKRGALAIYHLNLQGPDGQVFDTYTQLPERVVYAPEGILGPQLDQIEWGGVFSDGLAEGEFTLRVSSDLSWPAQLPFTTTLTVTGFAPLQVTTRLMVNGYTSFLPALSRGPWSTALPPTPTPSPPAVTPTATPPPATPLPSPTAAPTATPAPNCSDLLVNGGFETSAAWSINTTSFPAAYSAEHHLSGNWSMRLGIPAGGANTYSFSSVDQTVSIPAGAASASLNYHLYPTSTDLSGDWFDFLVQDGSGWHWLVELRGDEQNWLPASQDLSDYVGQTITLRFRVFNDGQAGQTATWLDEVSLWVCTP